MLGSYGIQPVTVVFNNSKNCFLHLSPNLVSQLCLREVCVRALMLVFSPWVRA